jgi:hypothetical protein
MRSGVAHGDEPAVRVAEQVEGVDVEMRPQLIEISDVVLELVAVRAGGRSDVPAPRESSMTSARSPDKPPRSPRVAPGKPGPPQWHTRNGPLPMRAYASSRPSLVTKVAVIVSPRPLVRCRRDRA